MVGVRPNSVVHTTSVSSSMPRLLRSLSSPAIGLSTLRASGPWAAMSAWLSQLLLEPPVEPVQQAQLVLLHLQRRRSADQVGDRLGTGEHAHPLVAAGEKVAAPYLAPRVRELRCEDDERRQVLVVRAQSVADPRTQARPREGDRAGVDAQGGLEVVVVVA